MTSQEVLPEPIGCITGVAAARRLTKESVDERHGSSPLVFDLVEANVLDCANIAENQRLA